MKLYDLFESVNFVKLDDLFIFQDNSTNMDTKQIIRLAAEMKNDGLDDIEEILVAKLTPAVIKELRRIKEMHDTDEHFKQYRGTITDELLNTKKKFLLLDGNHRYLAAKRAGITALSYELITSVADIVSIMYSGEL